MIKHRFKDVSAVKRKIDQMISSRSNLDSIFLDFNKYLRLYVDRSKESVIED